MDYKVKYIKYKNKYLKLKNQIGASNNDNFINMDDLFNPNNNINNNNDDENIENSFTIPGYYKNSYNRECELCGFNPFHHDYIDSLNALNGLQFNHCSVLLNYENHIYGSPYENYIYGSPYINNIPISQYIDNTSFDTNNLGLGKYYESPLYNSDDIDFIIRVASINKHNYLFYYYLDINNQCVPLSRWSLAVVDKFNEVKNTIVINRDIVNINNYCNDCYTLKIKNNCILCNIKYSENLR
jgi:hypothetical protein